MRLRHWLGVAIVLVSCMAMSVGLWLMEVTPKGLEYLLAKLRADDSEGVV